MAANKNAALMPNNNTPSSASAGAGNAPSFVYAIAQTPHSTAPMLAIRETWIARVTGMSASAHSQLAFHAPQPLTAVVRTTLTA